MVTPRSPRERRLYFELQRLEELRDQSTVFDFEAFGDPPERYIFTFHGRGLKGGKGRIAPTDVHQVEVKLLRDYPISRPEFVWKTPVYHPNLFGGTVCLGSWGMSWTPTFTLDQAAEILWDMARFAILNPRSSGPSGADESAHWAKVDEKYGFPVDKRPLRDKVVGRDERSSILRPAEDEDDIVIIEDEPGICGLFGLDGMGRCFLGQFTTDADALPWQERSLFGLGSLPWEGEQSLFGVEQFEAERGPLPWEETGFFGVGQYEAEGGPLPWEETGFFGVGDHFATHSPYAEGDIVAEYGSDILVEATPGICGALAGVKKIPGIPKFGHIAKIRKVREPETWELCIQVHDAERAGRHYDLRLGDPETEDGHSWALRYWPEVGEKRLAVQQSTHELPYFDWEGEIESGYGKGKVRIDTRSTVEIGSADNKKITFIIPRGRRKGLYTLVHTDDKRWLLIRRS
jgi:ubiquitin-protein ligase